MENRPGKALLLLDVPFAFMGLNPTAEKARSNIIYYLGIFYSVFWEKHLSCACLKAYGLKSWEVYGNELGRKGQLCSGTLTGTIGTTCSICSPGGVTQFNETLTWVLNLARSLNDSMTGVRDWVLYFREQRGICNILDPPQTLPVK